MINSSEVHELLMDCLFIGKEKTDNAMIIDGIAGKFGLNPIKVEKNKKKILEILKQLPLDFRQEYGGGMSFLNMGEDKDGNHWGEHRAMEQLVVLGLATKNLVYLMPKEMWSALPGQMPYLVLKLNFRKEKLKRILKN